MASIRKVIMERFRAARLSIDAEAYKNLESLLSLNPADLQDNLTSILGPLSTLIYLKPFIYRLQ